MKIFRLSKRNGYALLMVLAIVGIAALTAASTMRRTFTVSMLNQRAKQFQNAMYAAESAVEKVYARIRYDYVNGGDAAVSNNISLYQGMYPTSAENPQWAKFEFSNAQGVLNQCYVSMISNKVYKALDGSVTGLNGWQEVLRVISNARPLTDLNPVAAGVQQDIALDVIPAFQFAIFYNGQLEFTQCAPLTIRGRTHANGPICMGAASGSTLQFNGTVSTTASIVVSNLGGYSGFATPVYAGSPASTIGAASLNLPIGTNSTPTAVREIINLPPAGESATSAMGQQRFYDKAAVVLLVSNLNVTMIVKDLGSLSGTSTNVDYWSTNPPATQRTNLARAFPFLSLTNTFRDYREGSKWVMPTQIDMGMLRYWLPTNPMVLARFPAGSGTYPTIMYVADFRTITNMHAVRLTNGVVIPTNGTSVANALGFTLATINPLYVWGDYNCPNAADLGTTNVAQTFPASLISDAITVLSSNWKDTTYGTNSNLTLRPAAATDTINAAIIAGTVFTTGTGVGNWSGGVHNMTRLLESWTGSTLTLNSSLVMLYNSAYATNQYQNAGLYYRAPTRNFNYEQRSSI